MCVCVCLTYGYDTLGSSLKQNLQKCGLRGSEQNKSQNVSDRVRTYLIICLWDSHTSCRIYHSACKTVRADTGASPCDLGWSTAVHTCLGRRMQLYDTW